jgi:hypothetical protein
MIYIFAGGFQQNGGVPKAGQSRAFLEKPCPVLHQGGEQVRQLKAPVS